MRARAIGRNMIEVFDERSEMAMMVYYHCVPSLHRFGRLGMWFANLKIWVRYRLLWRLYR